MKRWTSTWTAMLVVGLLAVPGIGLAQTSPAAAPSATSSATAQDKSAQGTASPASPATQSPATTPTQQPATPATPPAEPTPSTQPPATPPQQPATPPTDPTSPAQPPASTTQPPADPSAQDKVNPDAAKQALTAARDSLAQMTQLPAAQALTGEPRAQVSQLISNFNELITANAEWKASYAKVEANLNALLGSQGPDESAAPSPAPATAPPSPTAPPSSTTPPTAGAAGAVGTSGTTTGSLDPGIKAKLAEFRTHLKEFEKAAGGSAAK